MTFNHSDFVEGRRPHKQFYGYESEAQMRQSISGELLAATLATAIETDGSMRAEFPSMVIRWLLPISSKQP